MRYLSLALAVLFALLFLAIDLPPQQETAAKFLTALVRLPVISLANFSFLLGAFAGMFLAVFALSLRHNRSKDSVASAVRAST
jgi:uncharacterized integral membrane protein